MSDSTDASWPAGLPAPLLRPKHSFRNLHAQTEMESRRIRMRRTSLQPRELVDIVWRFTSDQYATFETFFKDTLQNGAFAFLLPLQGDGGVVDRKVSFVDSTYRFDRSDALFVVSATVEALESEDYS